MKPHSTPIKALSRVERDAMFSVLDRCFHGVTRKTFEADLQDKTIAIRLLDEAGTLQGFSTLALYPATGPKGHPVTIACSGDTIVAPEAWGSSTLSRAWIDVALRWHARHGQGDLYWLLITSGVRTYRFLPVFFKAFYPVHNCPTPAHTLRWMNELATARWGNAYDSATGIVRFEQPQRLRGELAQIPAGKPADRHVRHFLDLNPGHTHGDELVSLCKLSQDNLTRAGQRMVNDPGGFNTDACEATP